MRIVNTMGSKDRAHGKREFILKMFIVMIVHPTTISMIRYLTWGYIINEFRATQQNTTINTIRTTRILDSTTQIMLTELCLVGLMGLIGLMGLMGLSNITDLRLAPTHLVHIYKKENVLNKSKETKPLYVMI